MNGVFIVPEVRIWSGTRSLNKTEVDAQVINPLVKLGQKLIVPKEALAKFYAIRTNLHTLLTSNTVKLPFGYFVLDEDKDNLINNIMKFKKEFDDNLATLINDLDELKQEALRIWEESLSVLPEDMKRLAMHSILRDMSAETPEAVARKFLFNVYVFNDSNDAMKFFFKKALQEVTEDLLKIFEKLEERANDGKLQKRNLQAAKNAIEKALSKVSKDTQLAALLSDVYRALDEGVGGNSPQEDALKKASAKISALLDEGIVDDAASAIFSYSREVA